MKTLAWFASLAAVLVLPAICAAQYSGTQNSAAQPTRSVLRSADHAEWVEASGGTVVGNYNCCSKPLSCTSGVCQGYDNCCPRPPMLCCLKRVARMLDCLLPCNKCCPGGCLFANCRPHLFERGHCGGCKVGCSTSCSSGCPSCSTPVGHPVLSDPFQDDPVPPKPMAEPAHDVRVYPAPSSRSSSPYKVTTRTEVAKQRAVEATTSRPAPTARVRDRVAMHSGARVLAAQKSAIRPAAVEVEMAIPAVKADPAPSPPALLPTTIRQTSAQLEIAELEIPVNPLRR